MSHAVVCKFGLEFDSQYRKFPSLYMKHTVSWQKKEHGPWHSIYYSKLDRTKSVNFHAVFYNIDLKYAWLKGWSWKSWVQFSLWLKSVSELFYTSGIKGGQVGKCTLGILITNRPALSAPGCAHVYVCARIHDDACLNKHLCQHPHTYMEFFVECCSCSQGPGHWNPINLFRGISGIYDAYIHTCIHTYIYDMLLCLCKLVVAVSPGEKCPKLVPHK